MNAYRLWFYAAAAYNLVWGAIVVAFPLGYFRLLGMEPPNYPALLQVVGMMVAVFAYGYYLLAQDPHRFAPIIWIGLAGKTFGPIGYVVAAVRGELPWSFGWVILTNDLVWWPAFWSFALRHARGKA